MSQQVRNLRQMVYILTLNFLKKAQAEKLAVSQLHYLDNFMKTFSDCLIHYINCNGMDTIVVP